MLTYQAAVKKVSEGKFAPVYLFFGEESYLHEDLVELLSRLFLGEDSSFGLEKIPGNEVELQEVISKLGETGLFSEKKLIIIDNPPYLSPPRKKNEKAVEEDSGKKDQREKGDIEIMEKYLEETASRKPDSILVLLAPKVDRRKRLFKLIDKQAAAVECLPLKGEALADWIRNKVFRLEKKIDRAAVERLLMAGEQNLHYLSNELEKYSVYLGEEKIITLQIVDQLFSGDIQGDIFKLADALAEGNLARAHDLLELLLRRREKPLVIFFMLTRHYRLLLQAHSLLDQGLPPAEFASALEVPSFAARKLREQAAFCSRSMLEEVIITLQRIDFQIKTGRTEPAEALKLVLGQIDCLQRSIRSSSVKNRAMN